MDKQENYVFLSVLSSPSSGVFGLIEVLVFGLVVFWEMLQYFIIICLIIQSRFSVKATGGWKWRRMCCMPVVLLFELGVLGVVTTASLSIVYTEYGSNGRFVIIKYNVLYVNY